MEDSLYSIRSLYEKALELIIDSYEARIEAISSETKDYVFTRTKRGDPGSSKSWGGYE